MANNITEDIMLEICKRRGIKLGEKFKVRSNNNFITGKNYYRLSENGLEHHVKDNWTSTNGIEKILTGEVEIIKLPFVPHLGDEYYSVNEIDKVEKYTWKATVRDYQNYAFDNCFETEEEAKAASQRIYSRLEKIYLDYTENTRIVFNNKVERGE